MEVIILRPRLTYLLYMTSQVNGEKMGLDKGGPYYGMVRFVHVVRRSDTGSPLYVTKQGSLTKYITLAWTIMFDNISE